MTDVEAPPSASPGLLDRVGASLTGVFGRSTAPTHVQVEVDVAGPGVHGSASPPASPPASADPEAPPPVQIVFHNVSIDVKNAHDKENKNATKRILNEVSGIFGARECIAVMGPSGSGKTTMLNALTGIATPTSGSILVNGSSFDKGTMRRVSAFVPQDDLLTPSLTLHEALMEACLFKTTLDAAAREQLVDRLIEQFNLSEARHVIIGHPEGLKGISGGQKRRLSVALELCGQPSLLFLDEPTSGLDAVSTMTLVRLLASLARGGMTVIASIHQPSAAAFFTFDRLLLLHQGAICYQGPLLLGQQPVGFFAAAGYECPSLENPADFMFDVVVGHADEIRQVYSGVGVPEDAGRAPDSTMPALMSGRATHSEYAASFMTQLCAHFRRNLLVMRRDPVLVRLRVMSATIIGAVIGTLYFRIGDDMTGINDIISLLLFSMLFLAISNALPVIIQILPELAVVHKECRNHWYHPLVYVPAKLLADTPLLFLPPLIYLTIMGNMTTLTWQSATTDGMADGDANCGRFFMLYLAIALVVNATQAWAMFLCALAPTTDVAVLLAPGSIMPMAVLSGFFKNQQDMTWIFRWFTYINYLNYSWQAMAIAGLHGRTFDVPPQTGLSTGEAVITNRLALPSYTGSTIGDYWANIGIVAGFVVFFRILAVLMVARRLSK